jgi:hypothetical protein
MTSWKSYSGVMKNAMNFWLMLSGVQVSYAASAEIQITVLERHHIQEDVQNAKLKNQQLLIQFFITANFQYIKLSILPIMYAGVKKKYPPMNLPEDYLFAR